MKDESSHQEPPSSEAKIIVFPDMDYYIRPNGKGTTNINTGLGIQTIRIQDDKLLLGDETIHGLKFDTAGVAWENSTSTRYCAGSIGYIEDLIHLEGVIKIGASKNEAIEYNFEACCFPWQGQPAHTLKMAAATTTGDVDYNKYYTTQITKARYADPNVPDPDDSTLWVDGLVFGTGYDPTTQKKTMKIGDSYDLGSYVAYTLDSKNKQIMLDINLTFEEELNGICDTCPTIYLIAKILFDATGTMATFTGSVTNTCADGNDNVTGVYYWKGQVKA